MKKQLQRRLRLSSKSTCIAVKALSHLPRSTQQLTCNHPRETMQQHEMRMVARSLVLNAKSAERAETMRVATKFVTCVSACWAIATMRTHGAPLD